MHSIANLFQEGGPTMYWVALLGMAGLVMGGLHAMSPKQAYLPAASALLFLILAAGAFGTWRGRHLVEGAALAMGPDLREQLLEKGYQESARPLELAGVTLLLVALPLTVGELRRRSSGPRSQTAGS